MIGACVAKRLGVASVCITHKVAGSRDIVEKVSAAFDRLNSARPADQGGYPKFKCRVYHPQNQTNRISEAERQTTLEDGNLLVIADSHNQIFQAKGSAYNLLRKIQAKPEDTESGGRFVLFKDEADSMLRTKNRALQLEKAIRRLELTTASGFRCYHGAQMIINISATLMPVFLEMQRTNLQPSGPVFFTSMTHGVSGRRALTNTYSGVESFEPLIVSGEHQYLDPNLPRDPNSLGINEQVEAMFEDLCDNRDGERKKGLLLDITLSRVYADGSIFDKAEECQHRYPKVHAVIYCGRGVVVRMAPDRVKHRQRQDGLQVVTRGSRQGVVILPRWERSIRRPHFCGSYEWKTDAAKAWGQGEDQGKKIGPARFMSGPGLRVARIDEVLSALEAVLETEDGASAGVDDTWTNDPIAVFGYQMMNRGTSFVTDLRVPTHLVLFMTAARALTCLCRPLDVPHFCAARCSRRTDGSTLRWTTRRRAAGQ